MAAKTETEAAKYGNHRLPFPPEFAKMMEAKSLGQPSDGVGRSYLTPLQLGQNLGLAGHRIRFHQIQLGRYAIEPVLDRWITDAEGAFQLFYGTVATDEDHDKNLVFPRQPGQRGQLEAAGDCRTQEEVQRPAAHRRRPRHWGLR